ncbi:MAG: HEAT repeat domain-containing protein [Candidatus Marinimicrobia bacterium]|jgi:HEAT repeat protein|nr:HEAT repeat domain-containing protein [Candidatus Neomarinimicrobiota bacterium]MBT4064910.1 HEAT repeat domain-containing protein [Candidatus Neomarinimicrobiota bacterium]MBT4308411.1 HEAT repeat domain-containing protein [Candidatus Neomarinimicrobiota bacterium]MBT4453035.1 HEAT repeat domain-containing protein [Candidatus Neomarinimicrobiota bacterium]MBT4737242.1 HEAT repeat domain-containing protein [Candidatus Neomarinimicrobiota bacterium]
MDNAFKKLSSANSSVILEGLNEIENEISNGVPEEKLPIMLDAVTSLFYIDAFDRPDLAAVLKKAMETVAKMGAVAVPLVLEKVIDADIKAELNFGRACGLMDENAIQPLMDVLSSKDSSDKIAFALYALGKIQSPKIVAVLPLILEKVNSPQKECEDTAVRALGKICENMNPDDVNTDFRESMFNALVSKLSHGNDVIRSKAIRNLGKLIRFGFANDIQTKEIMTKVKQAMGLDENRQLDPAFLVRREAQEILDLA